MLESAIDWIHRDSLLRARITHQKKNSAQCPPSTCYYDDFVSMVVIMHSQFLGQKTTHPQNPLAAVGSSGISEIFQWRGGTHTAVMAKGRAVEERWG